MEYRLGKDRFNEPIPCFAHFARMTQSSNSMASTIAVVWGSTNT